jgi:hypothetical protein
MDTKGASGGVNMDELLTVTKNQRSQVRAVRGRALRITREFFFYSG